MGSFFIPMAVMIYVYARISCVVASRHDNMTDIGVHNKVSLRYCLFLYDFIIINKKKFFYFLYELFLLIALLFYVQSILFLLILCGINLYIFCGRNSFFKGASHKLYLNWDMRLEWYQWHLKRGPKNFKIFSLIK